MSFADWLKIYRNQAGLSQTELAERIGKSRQSVNRFESGSLNPKTNTVREIALVLISAGAETTLSEAYRAAGIPAPSGQTETSEEAVELLDQITTQWARLRVAGDPGEQLGSDAPAEGEDRIMRILSKFGTVRKRERRVNLGSIPAGVPEEREAQFRTAHAGGTEYELTVKGNSMYPDFRDGDLIVVDPDLAAKPNDYVILVVNGESVLRQFIIEIENGERRRIFKAINDGYEDIKYGDIIVQGVVSRTERNAADVAAERRENEELRRKLSELESVIADRKGSGGNAEGGG